MKGKASPYWVRYDALNTGHPEYHARRYGCCRVVMATDADHAQAETRRIEGADWTLTFDETRPARASEVERQMAILHWMTLAKTGQAYRGLL